MIIIFNGEKKASQRVPAPGGHRPTLRSDWENNEISPWAESGLHPSKAVEKVSEVRSRAEDPMLRIAGVKWFRAGRLEQFLAARRPPGGGPTRQQKLRFRRNRANCIPWIVNSPQSIERSERNDVGIRIWIFEVRHEWGSRIVWRK